jgi:hypothetical protein
MTLQETKDIITLWINSCTTSEQLDLLLEVMDKFIFERYAGTVGVVEMDMAKTDLNETWLTRKLMVVSLQKEPANL